MKPKYPSNKYTIKFEYGQFCLYHDGKCVGTDLKSGRELGRHAWEVFGADEVCYDYDLGLDENIPLIPRHEKYKTRA